MFTIICQSLIVNRKLVYIMTWKHRQHNTAKEII